MEKFLSITVIQYHNPIHTENKDSNTFKSNNVLSNGIDALPLYSTSINNTFAIITNYTFQVDCIPTDFAAL